jgi:DNA-binding NarL/FixJ family response regulator
MAGKLTEEQRQDICKAYEQGKSGPIIAKELQINCSTVYDVLKKNGITIKKLTEANRKYWLNDTWLDNIDCEDKAYFLGLMWTDGNVNKDCGKFNLSFKEDDKYVLEYFSNILYGTNRVKSRVRNHVIFKTYEVVSNYAELYINSSNMTRKLINLGCIPNKTYSTRFPEWLNEDLYRHFIRGLIDGDGSILLTHSAGKIRPSVEFTGTIEIINDLEEILLKYLYIDIYINKRNRNKESINNIRSFRIYGFNKIKKFLDWIYQDSNIYFKRKYDKYIEFLQAYDDAVGKRFTIEQVYDICKLFDNGYSIIDISDQLDISQSSVRKILKRNNRTQVSLDIITTPDYLPDV